MSTRLRLARRRLLVGGASVAVGATAGCVKCGLDGETPEAQASPTSTTGDGDTLAGRNGPRASLGSSSSPNGETTVAHAGPHVPSRLPSTKTIYLLQLGEALEASDIDYVEAALRLYFPFGIERLPVATLPREAYYAPRQRYRAERLLEYLERQTPDDAQVMIGLTEVDISTTKGEVYDWGILGLATLSGRQCVISRFRAQRGAVSPSHVRQRLAKTVVHEVGHTIGLRHCINHGCIMEDGRGSVLTTDHERDVCAECRARAGASMLAVPAQLPW